jgi:Phosphotransferase enzyme family
VDEPLPHDPRQGWLAAILPADAIRMRVGASPLAATLADAGAELVEDRPDLELGPPSSLRGDARWAMVVFDGGSTAATRGWEGRSRVLRGARRLVSSAVVRLHAVVARRALTSNGYDRPLTVYWDQERPLRLPGRQTDRLLGEFFPLGVSILAGREAPWPTLLERAASKAAAHTGEPVELRDLRNASWGVLALGDSTVLRTTVGPASWQLVRQAEAMNSLRQRTTKLGAIVPWPLAHGKAGLAHWLLEPRLRGVTAPPALGGRLMSQALDVLAELHLAGGDHGSFGSPAADARVLSSAVDTAEADALLKLGERLEARLAQLPRCVTHGDFSYGNLLQEGGSLTGVVDWNKVQQGSLPLLDLINLLLTSEVAVSRRRHGRVFREYLLPWARAGGDDTVRAFCRRIGVELREGLLEDLVIAWWLDRHAQQVRTYSDRLQRPAWLRDNVERPFRALVGS